MGPNSFLWASRRNSSGFKSSYQGPNTYNEWSWQNARDYQLSALTEVDDVERERYLARAYRAIGQVIHLLQDLSQPQHVRDEHHLDKYPFIKTESVWKSPIETYGLKNSDALNYAAVALDWQAAGFVKMRDFWDRDFYIYSYGQPNAQALIDNENPGLPTRKLGLAEFVNGNFLWPQGRVWVASQKSKTNNNKFLVDGLRLPVLDPCRRG